ncbi:hypothetical protein GW964_01760 [Corynebacterium godavarianum]|uniref:hypothetical protein n=1 Tax=Corynebacterium godavarianum TaxID=2054421 RepID=UPI0019336A95|nr:hypothetical protein [Corynebacterium godavarianum]MBL7284986.1 hypothetical protein [Corynebacterium godavarianum]
MSRTQMPRTQMSRTQSVALATVAVLGAAGLVVPANAAQTGQTGTTSATPTATATGTTTATATPTATPSPTTVTTPTVTVTTTPTITPATTTSSAAPSAPDILQAMSSGDFSKISKPQIALLVLGVLTTVLGLAVKFDVREIAAGRYTFEDFMKEMTQE